ncbi:MAG: translocation/assembly module TamB domain-containing protein, partial [Bacteroidales bacterium]|nr:translocation/assembly module TamB domain-containing protein [Bacteroidales bacterium]
VHVDKGTVTANVALKDSLINGILWASANLRDSIKDYEVSASLRHLDLKRLRLWQRDGDTTAQFSTQLQVHLTGNNLESLYGTAVIDNTKLILNNDPVEIRSMALNVRNASNYKNISLVNDIVDAKINGYFNYRDIPLVVQRFCQQYLPQYYAPKTVPDSVFLPLDMDNINFDVTWLDTLDAIAPLMKQVMLAPGTELHGTYNYAEQLKLVLRSDSVAISSLTLYDIGVNTYQVGDKYNLHFSSQRIAHNSSNLQENVDVIATTCNEGVNLHWTWDNISKNVAAKNSGDITLEMHSSDTTNTLNVGQGTVILGKNAWLLQNSSPILFSDSALQVNSLLFYCADQRLEFRAQRNNDSANFACINFTNFKLTQLSSLLATTGLTIDGKINGDVKMLDLSSTPHLIADLKIDSSAIGGQPLGFARIRSNWDPAQKKVDVLLTTALDSKNGTIAPITASGAFDLTRNDQIGLNFEVLFNEFNLHTLQPLAKDIASELTGTLRGLFRLTGTTKQPKLQGTAYIENGAAKLAMTGVRYSFHDSIAFNDSEIVLSNFALHDPNNGTAFVDGNIRHDHLHHLALNLSLRSDKIQLLSTTPKDGNYYGTLNAKIDGQATGPLDDLEVHIKASTLSGSHLVALIDQQKKVDEAGYIQFVQPAKHTYIGRRERTTVSSNLQHRITVELDITPDMRLAFPIDYSQLNANVEAIGYGKLELALNSASPLSLIGDYVFNNGTMEVGLLGLLSKKFAIEEGSMISFPGNLDGALFDITALYTQRVNLSTLTGLLSTDNSQQMVEVQNVIAVSGTIKEPAINFDLRLPNADQSLQEEIFSYIDRTSEHDMLNQTFSLLLMKSFYSANAGGPQSTSGGSSLLANSLGSVVSDMVEFADINFDVTSGTELTTDQVLMNVNKSWDKVYFESTFGFGGVARNVQSLNTGNNLIGDMLLGYKINPHFHMYVFNRSNTNDYTRSDIPFKQGAGVKYSHDFDRWKDLFKKKYQKKEEK